MKKITFLVSFFLYLLLSGIFVLNAQVKEKINGNTIVFGKTYTKEELKKTNGFIRCASTEYEQYLQEKYPNRMSDAEFEAWLAPLIEKAQANKSQSGGVITIPVVVHVIHGGEAVGTAPNITDNQVISQITVMNQDFRRMFGTPGYNANPVGADTMIQFALAKEDPNGNPTNGIDRVNMCEAAWSTTDINNIVKPQTIWDPTQYMNMWSLNFSDTTLLGYAQFPTTTTPSDLNGFGGAANSDGVVAGYYCFGSSDYNDGSFILATGYDKGRTMTHEVGHFLGLRHIWGDTNCGTDYCADTPVHTTANGGCPTHPKSNTCGTTDEMFENYMDYTQDNCMNIFTTNQSQRMTAVMNNAVRRSTLKTSTKDLPIALFVNDAEIKVEKVCTTNSSATCTTPAPSLTLTIYNRGTGTLSSATISYSVSGGAAQIYNWTGSLSQDKFNTFTVPVAAGTASGTANVTITSVNGTSDQRATNNTASGSFVAPVGAQNYQFTNVAFRLQRDIWGSETTWNLKNSSGTTLYSGGPYADTSTLPALFSQTWNLPTSGCYIFTINDSYGDGICCGEGNGYFDLKSTDGTVIIYSGGSFLTQDQVAFKLMTLSTNEVGEENFEIFPIPVGDILNITKVSDKTSYQIHNAAGQLVDSGFIKKNQINVSKLITGNYIITIASEEFNGSVKFIKK